ncbi:MAG: phosphoadenosine phosphosulfate reductase family protein [Desulfitobacterium hafniense]|nr:phosphoadenosine phosphosulfate reductase family protein [Desulfitobacterium hafniense]
MLLVSYGVGTDSTAMLIEMIKRNVRPDVILFSDTSAERPETYSYLTMFSLFLFSNGFPLVTIVKAPTKLEEACHKTKSLPALAYGFKTCSLRFKVEPQNKYINHHQLAIETWGKGEKIIKAIGYEYGEERRAKQSPDKKYTNWYPLIEWEMDRDACIKTIADAGLPQPGKSSCFFCPSMKKSEILELRYSHPGLLKRALDMEQNAELTTIPGLGRSYSWSDFIKHTEYMEKEKENARCGEVALGNGNYQSSMFIDVVEQACGCYDG